MVGKRSPLAAAALTQPWQEQTNMAAFVHDARGDALSFCVTARILLQTQNLFFISSDQQQPEIFSKKNIVGLTNLLSFYLQVTVTSGADHMFNSV